MKNIFSKILIAFMALAMLVGCSQDFLEEPKPTDGVSEEVVFSSREGVEAFISGIMRRFRGQFPNAAGVSNTDSAGVNSLFYARAVKGNDIINSTTHFQFDYSNDNREPINRRTIFTWNYCFYMINQANALINGLEASVLAPADKKELMAYGYALRGFFYHQLVMEFAPTYSFDPNFPAPPIYKGLSLTGNGMSTVKDVYALIVDDLTKAVDGLTEDRLGKSYINKSVANGILAQVYQVMGNWPGAETAAKAAYGGNPTAVLDAPGYKTGFKDISNKEWMWGSAQTSDQSNYYYGFPHAGADQSVNAYFATYINKDFVSLFSATDVRNLFKRKSATITDVNDWRYWVTTKYSFAFDSDNPIMRTSEMILIDAEAKFRLQREGEAHDLLFVLQKNRDVNAVKSANTGAALLEEILVERRKELYIEAGVEWFDAKRLRRGITRTGNHRIGTPGNIPADGKRFYLKIPQSEIDANDLIDDSVNADR
jgi:hypothetical protein